jgi:hypothetical protein
MTATTGTISAVGAASSVLVQPKQRLDYYLYVSGSNHGEGIVQLEKSRNGGQTWIPARTIAGAEMIYTGTAAVPLTTTIAQSYLINDDSKEVFYRFNCLEYLLTSNNWLWSLEPDVAVALPASTRDVNSMCSGALAEVEYTIGDEGTNVRAIAIQLKDANGNDLDHVAMVILGVFSTATGTALATGGSTGIAIGTDGLVCATLVAKKLFVLTSEADGDIDLTWTDTGTEAVYLGIMLPNGKLAMSAVIANAA